jgi:hypothetical protein
MSTWRMTLPFLGYMSFMLDRHILVKIKNISIKVPLFIFGNHGERCFHSKKNSHHVIDDCTYIPSIL